MTDGIIIKTKQEIDDMREGGKRLWHILHSTKDYLLENQEKTGIELDEYACTLAKKLDATPAFRGYMDFPNGLIVSVNDSVVHGIPSSEKFNKGDIISLDFGLKYKNLYTDSAITFALGEVSPENERLITRTEEALKHGIDAAVIKNTVGDIGHAVEQYISEFGYGIIDDLSGHGVGKKIHEKPHVLNIGSPGSGATLREGMTLAIEPMIARGSKKVYCDKDGWTIKTADRSIAAHFEHTIAITKDGPLVLTAE